MMTSYTTHGRARDRAKVAGQQDHEVAYKAMKTGAPRDAVPRHQKSAGTGQLGSSYRLTCSWH